MLVKLNFIRCETQFHRVWNWVSLGGETQFHTLYDFSPANHAGEKNSKLRKFQLNSSFTRPSGGAFEVKFAKIQKMWRQYLEVYLSFIVIEFRH